MYLLILKEKFYFLIPDDSHDICKESLSLSEFYCSALDELFNDADKEVYVRYFHTHLQSMLTSEFSPVMGMSKSTNDIIAYTVSSEGDLYIDDTLRATNDSIFTPIGNIKDLTLSESINSWQMKKHMQIRNNLPDG
ncbi:hypothetical protein [Vibrio caribbeanicus]|uniref:hypothetical protein n=1 Tax=Vibrio caribbeanicus TaxID=701175 RepID=UPI002283C5BC|nr:hypothetical protein [Vibrio caribbeanicus]MCY9844343.1 hypothetical protein [Vibrio caribbeanicus]